MALPPPPATVGVIVGRDLVGDALIKLPFLRALRTAFPQAAIHWITSNGSTAYNGPLRNVTRGLIDVIWEMPGWIAEEEVGGQGPGVGESAVSSPPLAGRVREGGHPPAGTPESASESLIQAVPPLLQPLPQGEGDFASSIPDHRAPTPFFDLLIDTRNRWKLARAARRVPHGVFLAQAFHYLFSDRRPGWLQRHPAHLVDRLLELVELAAGYRPQATGKLPVPAEFMARARQILPPGPVYIGLAPGAGNRVKAWPRFKFERLAALQAAKGRIPVFLLGPAELSWYDELIAAVPEALFPLQAADIWGGVTINIEQTLAIGSLLTAAVANDSGTGHMLAAVDCPLVSLFGPTDPAKLAPRVSHGTVIKAQDFGGAAMRHITWEAVDAAVDELIQTIILSAN